MCIYIYIHICKHARLAFARRPGVQRRVGPRGHATAGLACPFNEI